MAESKPEELVQALEAIAIEENKDISANQDEDANEDDGVINLQNARRAKCKWFNVVKGWGFLSPLDGGKEVFVHQSVIKMGGFRSLAENEEVLFECKESGKGLEATKVSGPAAEDCKGNQFKPKPRKHFRKVRCYNCGEFSKHLANKCDLGPLPKRCHHCKKDDHLLADCPEMPEIKKEKKKYDKSEKDERGPSDV